jgi:HlyD family secretion protein
LLLSCSRGAPEALLGTLEWDQVRVLAETSEPVVSLEVTEGEAVKAGQVLLRLDPRRTDAELAGARAEVQRAQAQLAELQHGARPETVAAQRAQLSRAESDLANARSVQARNAQLFRSGGIARSQMDEADHLLQSAQAAHRAAQAQLTELLRGTRPEQLDQALALLAAAQATLQRRELTRERLDVRAPRDGRVDALPFRLGDQPAPGATLITLLAGDAPYARVWVPERLRAAMSPGQRVRVQVDGVDQAFDAVVRSVRSEPAFTPYYALSGDDAARLSYRAELVLEGEAARHLPAGLPCRAGVPR